MGKNYKEETKGEDRKGGGKNEQIERGTERGYPKMRTLTIKCPFYGNVLLSIIIKK